MADTHKDLDFLRFYHASEESLKDKDMLKNQAFEKYQKNVSLLFAVPAALQVVQISTVNRPSHLALFKYVRHLKVLALLGSFGCVWHEKLSLEKKWNYYNRFYPEPTQLQRTLVTEAQVYIEREAKGIEEESVETKLHMSPEDKKKYEQMYSLGAQQFPEGAADVNPSGVATHWGKS